MPREDVYPVNKGKSSNYRIGSAAEYSQVRNLAHGVKAGDATSIAFASKLMASTVRELAGKEGNAVLVPIPGHGGLAKYTLTLAEGIGNLTGLPVVNALISDRHEALYTVKKKHKNTEVVPLEMEQVKKIPVGMFPILIDNVLDTGKTASNAYKALDMETTKMAVLGDTIKFTHNNYTPYWRFHFKGGEVSMLLRDAYLRPGDRFKIEDKHYTVLNVYPSRTADDKEEIAVVNGKGGIEYLDSEKLSTSIISMPIPKFKEELKEEKQEKTDKEYTYSVMGNLFSDDTHPQRGFLRHETNNGENDKLVYDRPLTDAEVKIFQLRPDTELKELQGRELFFRVPKGLISMRFDSFSADGNNYLVTTKGLDGKTEQLTLPYTDVVKKVHSGKWRDIEYFQKKKKTSRKSRTNNKSKSTTMPNSRKQTVKQTKAAQSQSKTESVKMTANENGKSVSVNPVVVQYEHLKKQHPDALMLVRVGDFYETYFKDAEKASEVLGITLTRRNDNLMPLAGFPHHALDTYLPKLIRAGLRVAITDPIDMEKAQELLKDKALEREVNKHTSEEVINKGQKYAKIVELVSPGKEQEAVKAVQDSSLVSKQKETKKTKATKSSVQKTTKEDRENFVSSIVAITGKRNHEAFETNILDNANKGISVEDKYGHEHTLTGIKVLRGRLTFVRQGSGVKNLQVIDLSPKSLKQLSDTIPSIVKDAQDKLTKKGKDVSYSVENKVEDKIESALKVTTAKKEVVKTVPVEDVKSEKATTEVKKPAKSTKAQRDSFTQAIVAVTGTHVHKPLDVDFGENKIVANTTKGEKIRLSSMQVLRGRVTFTDTDNHKVQLVSLSAFTLAKLQSTMVDLAGAAQRKINEPMEQAKAKAEEKNRVVVASDDQQQKFVEQIRDLMGKEKSITLPDFGTKKGVVASAGNEGVSFIRLYNWNDNISFAGTVPGDDNKEIRYYHPKDIRPEFYNYLVGEVRKAMKPALVTENDEKVTNIAIFEDTKHPNKYLIYGKLDGKGVYPKTLSESDYDAYLRETISPRDLFVKYFPSKMAKKLPKEQFDSLKLSNGKELKKVHVYKQRDENKPHYNEWLLYAESADRRYHATPMSQSQVEAYFDKTMSLAKLAENVIGEQLHVKGAYDKYRLPDPDAISQIAIRKSTSGDWFISAEVKDKGWTDEHKLNGNDLYALFKGKIATRPQLAAKYLTADIEDLSMSKKVERTQSMKR